jgi:uncharacterized Zn-finger protein
MINITKLDDGDLKPYKCQYEGCGKRFTKSSNLTQHLRIHSGKKISSFFFSFYSRFVFRDFVLGEKPFHCDLCGRSFRQSGNLTKHLKSHENAHLRWNRSTSEKPFKCPHEGCDKSFTAKSSLQNHVRSHSIDGIPLSLPPPAEKQSSTRGSNISIIKPPKEKIHFMRYQCIHPNCKKSFSDESELRAHLIAYNPGMAAENQFLRDSVISLLSLIDETRGNLPQVRSNFSLIF